MLIILVSGWVAALSVCSHEKRKIRVRTGTAAGVERTVSILSPSTTESGCSCVFFSLLYSIPSYSSFFSFFLLVHTAPPPLCPCPRPHHMAIHASTTTLRTPQQQQQYGDSTRCDDTGLNDRQNSTQQAPAGVFQPDGPESLRVLVTPPLLLLQGMLSSLPANALLAEQAAALLARHARLVRHVLLFKESSLDALDAMSAVLAVLTHVSKPPFQVCMYVCLLLVRVVVELC